MAMIVTDGLREWATDVADRKLGRAIGVIAGLTMVLAVLVIDPGATRVVLAAAGPLLILRATQPKPPPPREDVLTTTDLVDVEELILETRIYVDERTDAVTGRLDGITATVSEIADRV